MFFSTIIASKVYTSIDNILLGFMTSDHNVGIYNAAVKTSSMVLACFGAMYNLFLPRIVSYIDASEYGKYYELLKKYYP